jgi:hypothetical protein
MELEARCIVTRRQSRLDDAMKLLTERGDVCLVNGDAREHVGLIVVHEAVRAGLVDVQDVHA